jgi:hypothetical protein
MAVADKHCHGWPPPGHLGLHLKASIDLHHRDGRCMMHVLRILLYPVFRYDKRVLDSVILAFISN